MPDTDEFLFGAPPGAPRAKRRPQREYTATEDLLILQVVLACGSEYAYGRACVFLCEVLDRPPYEGEKPSQEEYTRGAVAQVEMRVVTRTLECDRTPRGGQSGVGATARRLFGARRAGLPFTWAEHEKVLLPGVRKKSTVSLELLCVLLERDRTELPTTRPRRLRQTDQCPDFGSLKTVIPALRDASTDTEEGLWAELHAVLRSCYPNQ